MQELLTAIAPISRALSAPEIDIFAPPVDRLARLWHIIEPILRRATNRAPAYEPIDILQLVMAGRMTLFVITEDDKVIAVCVTELKQHPRLRVLEVPFIAGTGLKRWHGRLLEVLDAQAEALQCSDILGFLRRGWQRFGFEEDGVILRRRVGG